MKIFLDDERQTPEGYTRCYWPDEVITLLQHAEVTEISLDHDLGDDRRGTGYDVLLWIEREVLINDLRPPVLKVHSANPPARDKMRVAISTINRIYLRRKRNKDDAHKLMREIFRHAIRCWKNNTFEKNNQRYYRKGVLVVRRVGRKGEAKFCSIRTEWVDMTLNIWDASPVNPKTNSCLNLTVMFLKDQEREPLNYVVDMPNYCSLQRYLFWINETLTDVFNSYKVY